MIYRIVFLLPPLTKITLVLRQHIDAALEQVNEAIEWLNEEASEDTDYHNLAPTLERHWTELRQLYGQITLLLGNIGHEVAHLDFAAAGYMIPKLDASVAGYDIYFFPLSNNQY